MVVHHDAELPDGRLIKDLTVAELPPEVPLLGAALDALDGLFVNIEIKNADVDPDHDPDECLAAAVASLVAERGLYDRVVVSSFAIATTDAVAEADPEIACGYLTSPRWDQAAALQRAIDRGYAAFHPNHVSVNQALVDAAHEAGLQINVWTVDDPDRLRWLAGLGVDAVITNVPDAAIAALRGPRA